MARAGILLSPIEISGLRVRLSGCCASGILGKRTPVSHSLVFSTGFGILCLDVKHFDERKKSCDFHLSV